MRGKKRSLLGKVDWKRTLVAFSILIILLLLPIAVYLYTSRTIDSVAYTLQDNYEDTTHINADKSSNYEIVSNAVKILGGSPLLGDGADGACSVTSGTVSLDTSSCSGRATADAINFVSTVNTTAGSSAITVSTTPTGLSVGDEILIINLQGSSSNYANVGNYEIHTVGSIVGSTITFGDGTLMYGYDGTTQKIMVQRIPNYTTVSVSAGATLTTSAWNGTKGGVLFLKAQGTVTVAGSINMTAKGYRGGGNTRSGGEAFCGYNNGAGGPYTGPGLAGSCGGGGGGGGITSASPGCWGFSGGIAGSVGGAGGGGGSNWWEGSAGDAGGGGGGGYGTFGYGGVGAYSGTNGGTNVSGAGGSGYYAGGSGCRSYGGYGGGGGGGGTYGDANLSKLYLGSGGAQGGGVYTNTGSGLFGGAGGGILSIYADTITVTGNIQNNGGAGQASSGSGAGCGGGSGGSVYLRYKSITGDSLITVTGGAAGAAYGRGRAGGAGGSGRKASSTVPTYSTNMILESVDLVPGDNLAVIKSFAYSLSALPTGTTASIQFSQDSSAWYNASGVLGGQNTLSVGEMNNINLESLAWETTSFYYKITFTSDGTDTPILDGIALEFDSAPASPTIGTPQAMSTDTIRWNFTDNADNEEGFMLLDESNNLIKYCLGENLTYCDESGLSENTQYTRKIKAYNTLGESEPSASAQAFTLVSAPTLSFGSKSSSMITIEASNIVNGAEIYFDCDGENCDTGINEWTTNSTVSVTGLDNNTGYSFRVKARNGDDVESPYSTSLTGYTLAVVPEVVAGPLSSTSISLSVEGVNNLAAGSSGVYFECKEEVCNEGIAAWEQSDTDVVINLEPNKEYQFRAKVRNYDGVETSFSEYISVYTGASVPDAPVEKEKSTSSVKIGLVKGNNPDTTEYAVFDETTGKYLNLSTNKLVTDISWGTYAQYGADSGVNVSGLTAGVEYKFKVKARNADNLESEYSPILSVFTKLLTPTLLSATDIQKTSVNWNVTDTNTSKVGYKIYDQAGNLLLTCSYSNMSTCKETNLASNTTYSRKVKVYTNNSESDFSAVFQVTTLAQDSAILSLTPTGHDSFALSLSGNARDTIQVLEEQSNQYLNRDLNVLTSNASSLSYSNTVNVLGLKPNTRYSFKVKSINNQGVATNWSTTISAYTFAEVPAMVKIERINNEIAKLYINNLDNPSNTDIAIRETNTNKYLDFTKNILVNDPVWGKFTDFGGVNGIEVRELELGKQYGFATQAKNTSSVETALSESLYIGASAILKNVDSMLKATLVEKTDVDLTNPDNGQYGEKEVRILEGEYLVADIPVLFAKDRDWADVVLATSPREKKTVIKLNENHGVLKPFTMYVVGEDTNVFVLCPGATKLADIGPSCEGGVKYTGPFPQKIKVEGNDVYVSVTVIGGVKYWVADGLTGTGGMGYYEETKNVEEKEDAGVVLQVFDDIKGTIDEIEKPQLQTITVATGAVSVAVGTTAALGGLSQFAYSIGQFFLSIFSALGYRRKRIHYGFVYDSQTKEPLSLAVVRIMDMENKLVGTEVTNMNGRITGNLEPGEYTIMVSKRGYKFPSENIKGSEDYPISNVYTGKLVVSSSDSNIQIAIPMDPVEMSKMDRAIVACRSILSKFALLLNFVIFVGGILLVVYMYQKYPEKENLLIALVYILPLYTLVASLFDKNGKYGKVILKKNRKPVDGISVFIKEREFNKIVAKRVTNEKGMYRFIVDKGRYEISIDSNKYKLLNSIEDVVIDVKKDNYMITKKLRVKEV